MSSIHLASAAGAAPGASDLPVWCAAGVTALVLALVILNFKRRFPGE